MNPRLTTLAPPRVDGSRPLVLCHGLVATDFLVRTTFPVPRDVKVQVDGFVRQGGGPAANAAVALTRLGLDAAFVGGVGDDGVGREQIEELRAEGVDVSGVQVRRGEPSFVSFILVDGTDGSRTILSAPSQRPRVEADRPAFPARSPDLVLVDGWGGEHQERTCRAARETGIPTLLDAGSCRRATRDLARLCDVVIASTPFADEYLAPGREADVVRRLLEDGARLAAVTRGERGVLAGAAGSAELFEVPAVPTDVVDTTGAGDAFHAGAAWGLVEGRTWEESLLRGAAVASRKCRSLGARAGLPRRAELERDGLTA